MLNIKLNKYKSVAAFLLILTICLFAFCLAYCFLEETPAWRRMKKRNEQKKLLETK